MERKLATILATDIVGFAGLVSRDEGGTIAKLVRLEREVIGMHVETRFNVIAVAISAKLPGAHRAADAPPVWRKVGSPMSGSTWEEDEIFALAGFSHDEADILRLVLSALNSRASWEIVKQKILEKLLASAL
ncbi:hypothetical protein [Ruegeria arenilitoris]|uniref:hypothetical protein n=1 Tax=Ruegeria arenilitoris TaxID=1173585 RepID=UPI001479D547|nr:hypothetical protein [Ruegeria arenilitoris]